MGHFFGDGLYGIIRAPYFSIIKNPDCRWLDNMKSLLRYYHCRYYYFSWLCLETTVLFARVNMEEININFTLGIYYSYVIIGDAGYWYICFSSEIWLIFSLSYIVRKYGGQFNLSERGK